jgi:hypothetical protein
MTRVVLAALAYVVPTFILGFVWHLMLFAPYYAGLRIYRDDIIIPFGLAAMTIQAIVFAWIYRQGFATRGGSLAVRAAAYGALGAALSWSFTTLAVGAKNLMTSVPDYVLIETAFTLVQWVMVAPLTALAFGTSSDAIRRPVRRSA